MQIIEKMIKLARIISTDTEESIRYKNHMIAKAILDTRYTNQTTSNKRNDIFTIIAGCQKYIQRFQIRFICKGTNLA